MGGEGQKHFIFDLPPTVDEVVVLMAQAGIPGAANESVVRFLTPTHELIQRLGHNKDLHPEDIDDAKQEAYFWIQEAIAKYDPWQMMKPDGCSFGTGVWWILFAACGAGKTTIARQKNGLGIKILFLPK